MRRVAVAVGAVVLVGVLWAVLRVDTGGPAVPRSPAPAPTPVAARSVEPLVSGSPSAPEPEPEQEPPDSGIPAGAEWGTTPEDALHEEKTREQRERVKKELYLPPPILERFGAWDGYTVRPERLALVEQMTGRPVDAATQLELQTLWAEQSEAASLAVGEYRLGRLDESQTVEQLEAAGQAFRSQVKDTLGLTDAQFDSAFGLGTL